MAPWDAEPENFPVPVVAGGCGRRVCAVAWVALGFAIGATLTGLAAWLAGVIR